MLLSLVYSGYYWQEYAYYKKAAHSCITLYKENTKSNIDSIENAKHLAICKQECILFHESEKEWAGAFVIELIVTCGLLIYFANRNKYDKAIQQRLNE